jgi:hypothetical protein
MSCSVVRCHALHLDLARRVNDILPIESGETLAHFFDERKENPSLSKNGPSCCAMPNSPVERLGF